ncbi:NB-ARC domain-containing protein [Streptomyces ardesiacus]|uniref:NB-ARC domain-containing protein n=1 Tax=Streptomyces ardesiacus TaxID=285564 RepID=UPI003665BE2D
MSDAFLPESHEELLALFRSRTAGRRILVVLDDVDQAAQARALIPKGAGSMLLVTSNLKLHELALDGARSLHLGPLDMDSGLQLLAQRCGEEAVEAERGAAERIVMFCDGLPKALQVVAARLVTDAGLTMTRLADELADETRRLRGLSLRGAHSVSAALELVYRALSPDAACLYRAVGWIPGRTFDVGTAAVAARLDPAETEGLLRVLEEASLVDMTDDGRFRLHNLVRLHARECSTEAAEAAPDTSQRAVVERVATHYLALTAYADRAIRQDRLRIGDLSGILHHAPDPFAAEDGPDPLAWLEAERTNILPVLRDASRLGLHTHVWQLSEGFTVLFFRRRYLEDWKESLELGAFSAAAAMVPAAEGRLRSLLSRPLMDLKRYEQARSELEKAAACADVSGHTALRASVQEFCGRYWDRFDPARAVEAYRHSVELNIEAQEWRGVAIATYFLGCAQDAIGRHEQALDTLRRARQDLLARDDERMAARALAAIGTVHDHLGDPDTAMSDLREAADTLVREKATHYAAQAFELLADITQRAGGPAETVREHLLQAHGIYERGGSPKADELRERLDGLSGTN